MRGQNWTENERVSAIEAIHQHADILFGKYRGASYGSKEKEQKWDEIATSLHASGKMFCVRDAENIKKMYSNMKTRGKEKYDANKKTGGGAHKQLSPAEDLVMQHLLMNNREVADGISHGVESVEACTVSILEDLYSGVEVFQGNNIIISAGGDACSNTPQDVSVPPIINSQRPPCNIYNTPRAESVPPFQPTTNTQRHCSTTSTSSCVPVHSTIGPKRKSSKRQIEDKENDLYSLENKRLKAEIEKFEAETFYFKEKTRQNEVIFLLKEKTILKELEQ